MASTQFVNGTLVTPDWLQDVNDFVYGGGGGGGDDASNITYTQDAPGAKQRNVAEKLDEISLCLNDFEGADPTGATPSDTAMAAAIAACPIGGTLRVNGTYRFSSEIQINKTMTLEGPDTRVANVTSGANSRAFFNFVNDTNGIVVTGPSIVTLRGLVISGQPTSTYYGVTCTDGAGGAVILDQTTIQVFLRGLNLKETYYSKVYGGAIVFCETCVVADYCYNLELNSVMLRAEGANSVGVTCLNGTQLTLHGCSVESWQLYGIGIYGGSIVNLFGTYFEGVGGGLGWTVLMSDKGMLNAIGCLVYLTAGSVRWVSVEDASSTAGVHVYSRNNQIRWPESPSTIAAIGYTLNNNDTSAFTDIAGDTWPTSAGTNCRYLGNAFFAGYGPVYGRGQHKILHPSTHPYSRIPVDTTPFPPRTAYTIPFATTMYPNPTLGDRQITYVTSNSNITFGAPLAANAFGGEQQFTLTISNTSGGAMGTVTFDGYFYRAASFTPPAHGFSKSITFRWTGSHWVEVGRTPSDVPN